MFLQLQQFIGKLGWQGLHRDECPDSQSASERLDRYFYRIGEMDDDIYVQINSQSEQHPHLFAVNVYAMRFRICSGWHGFMLAASSDHQQAEVPKVWQWAANEHFRCQASRRMYRRDHPECAGYSWRRIQMEGPPYWQSTCYERWRQVSASF